MKGKYFIAFVIFWIILYSLFLWLIFRQIDSLSNSLIYIASILSFSGISFFIPFFLKNANTKKIRLLSFFIPFSFGVLLVAIFVIAMANIESFYSTDLISRIVKTVQLLPYALGKGLLLGLPMGALGYLFGGISSLIMKKTIRLN